MCGRRSYGCLGAVDGMRHACGLCRKAMTAGIPAVTASTLQMMISAPAATTTTKCILDDQESTKKKMRRAQAVSVNLITADML